MRTEEKRKKTKKRQGRYRKAAIIATLLILVIVPLIGSMNSSGYGIKYDRSVIEKVGNPDAKEPKIEAGSAILYSEDMRKPLFEKNPDKEMPPYSITKLMTCYLALENLDLDETVKISKNATRELKDGMEMELDPGDEMSARDLIYATMMMSANDAAIAIGEAVAGSEKAFVTMMNEQAKEWGCKHTHFVNTNGWENKKHYTSARDMAIITEKSLENEILRKISMTKRYTAVYRNKDDDLFMINAFLKTTENIENLTGGKTGTWSENESTIALEFSEQGHSGVIVLLGDSQDGRARDIKKLLKYAHEASEGFVVARIGEPSFETRIKGGSRAELPIYTMKTCFAYPQSGREEDIEISTKAMKIEAPVSKGQKVGSYAIKANDRVCEKGYLYAAKDIEKGMFLSRFYVSDHATWLIVAIAVLLNLLGFILDKRAVKES